MVSRSTCCYCGVGCGILVNRDRTGKITVEGDKDHPVNRGLLCSKGMNLHHTVMDGSDRLGYPEMRFGRDHPLERVSWDSALDRAAAVFGSIISEYGPDSVGFYISGQCLTEEYYVINKLMKGFIGSNNIDTNSRLCMSSAVVGYKLTLGEDSVPVSYDDIELADCFLIAGANPAWCHPILWRRIEAHKAAHPEIKIIVVDPRRTQTCELADLHLALKPGTDVTLFNAIGRILIENGWIDQLFLDAHVEGYDDYKTTVFKKTVEEAAEVCGLVPSELLRAARLIADSKGFLSLWAMGLNQSVIGVNKNLGLMALNLITGHIAKPGSGPFSLTGQPNAMGGREVGGLSNLLPAHRNLADPTHREEVARFWGSQAISAKPGLSATEMFDALVDGRMKAIWIACTNPVVSMPDARKVEAALKNARFVVVQDVSRRSETLKFADLVLPAATWAEKEGTMTNSERRITYLSRVVDPPGEALPDSEIICRFARKMGFRGFEFTGPDEIYREHAALTRGTKIDISGVDYPLLKMRGSIQWPFPTGSTHDTPRLFQDRNFATPSGRARLYSLEDANESEKTNPEFPLILTTGRIRDQWHTMTRTGKVSRLQQHQPCLYLEMHPTDSVERGLSEGDLVEVKNGRGSVRAPVRITTDIRPGVVFLPMHWGRSGSGDLQRTNNLTSPLIDPRSKEPDLKFSAVQVARYEKPRQTIVVVGAGSGAWGFVNSYRDLNQNDEILVFGKEPHPFYNRILLPDYVSGHRTWEELLKDHDGSIANTAPHVANVSIVQIDRTAKTVVDSRGKIHHWDLLVLATGSRAHLPKGIPENLDGIFTMRTRDDADRLRSFLTDEAPVVIVGGGLLGIEMAGALRELSHPVTILQRSSKLMDRQLDALASQLLLEELIDRDIEIVFNDEIRTFVGEGQVAAVTLKSGRKLPCSAVLYAVGTVPNVDLAREAGLACNRGVLVDESLCTSDENIFAVGEIAEFEGALYGVTSAAEEQAESLARQLNGDASHPYRGSLSMNILKLPNLEVCSLGLVETPEDPEYEEVLFIDKASRYYKKCIIHKNRLVGALLIGDKAEFIEFRDLIQQRMELSEKRLALLRSGKRAEPVIGRVVCSCNSVGSGNIENRIREGCRDFSLLLKETGAGMGCGSCRPEVKRLLEQSVSIENPQVGVLV